MTPYLAFLLLDADVERLPFVTYFNKTESPISQNGRWRHADNAWHHVQTSGGLAFSDGFNVGYDDAYAYLRGFPSNQKGSAIVKLGAPNPADCAPEVEILLRVSDTASTVRAYEVLLNDYGLVQIVRWNGAMGDFSVIGDGGHWAGPLDGVEFSAQVVGSTITAYVNDVLVATATDSQITTGQPGIGFFRRDCGAPTDITFTQYIAEGL